MDLKDRILRILDNSGLTPSEFADKIDVPRSSVSHITSGRNRPSLDFIIKVKESFPDIDTDWLVFGIEKEEEIKEDSIDNSTKEISPDSGPTLFDLSEFEEKEESPRKIEKPGIFPRAKNSEKKINRVLLFFDDGTFEDFISGDSGR